MEARRYTSAKIKQEMVGTVEIKDINYLWDCIKGFY